MVYMLWFYVLYIIYVCIIVTLGLCGLYVVMQCRIQIDILFTVHDMYIYIIVALSYNNIHETKIGDAIHQCWGGGSAKLVDIALIRLMTDVYRLGMWLLEGLQPETTAGLKTRSGLGWSGWATKLRLASGTLHGYSRLPKDGVKNKISIAQTQRSFIWSIFWTHRLVGGFNPSEKY